MNLVTPKAGAKHELLFNKPAISVTKIISLTIMNFVTPKVGAKHELSFTN
jgi:hypothetical protein